MFLIDALARQERIEKTALLHEQSCAIASDGFNQYHGYLASVVCVTTGPGGTNAITGVAASWIDSTPLLVLSGQVPTHMMMRKGERQRGPQEVAITKIVEPITKHAGVFNLKKIGKPLPELIRMAKENQSGPVWLDVPLDVQSASI